VTVVLDPHRAVRHSQQVRVVDEVGGVCGIRIPGPFEIPDPPVRAVGPAVIG
jgi:hypothetical protein